MTTYNANETVITQNEKEDTITIEDNIQSEVVINTIADLTLNIKESPKSATVYRIKRKNDEKIKLNITGTFTCKYYLDDIKSGFEDITMNGQKYEAHTKNHVEIGRYKYDFGITPPLQIFHTVDNIQVGIIDKTSDEFEAILKTFKDNVDKFI